MLTDAKNKADGSCERADVVHRFIDGLFVCVDVFPCTERRRREAIAAATCLTEALVDHLNVGYEKSAPCVTALILYT